MAKLVKVLDSKQMTDALATKAGNGIGQWDSNGFDDHRPEQIPNELRIHKILDACTTWTINMVASADSLNFSCEFEGSLGELHLLSKIATTIRLFIAIHLGVLTSHI